MPESRVKWIANEGVRASRIVQALKAANQSHPLLEPLYQATPASARIGEPKPGSVRPAASPKESVIVSNERNPGFPIEVTLQIFADGRVVPGASRAVGATESAAIAEEARRSAARAAKFDAPFDDDYAKRKGYQADFLGPGARSVSLPALSDALAAEAAPLIKPVAGNQHVLHYHNFSVVMHAARRLAIYSAANVSFAQRYDMNRPQDVWRRDPRILSKYQVEGWYYAANQFDRGHLTRREDLEFGASPSIALQSAADTCHWTNCTPQHARFNQNKVIWQGIERYILEESIYNGHVNAQIFTGPVLDPGDPEYKKIQYPLQFWKVVAALDSDGNLFATAYLASQEEVIAQYGIEITEVPFGAYKTFQTSVAEIERLTGLKFHCGANGRKALAECVPLSVRPATGRRPRRPAEGRESTVAAALPPNYFEIADLDDIQLKP
jgi:endonuclease G